MCECTTRNGVLNPCSYGYQVVCPPMGPYLMTMKEEEERKGVTHGAIRIVRTWWWGIRAISHGQVAVSLCIVPEAHWNLQTHSLSHS